MSVGVGCEDESIIFHLMLHTLGMWHEQNRVDRDDYITLHPENMMNGAQVNFHKYHLIHPKGILAVLKDSSKTYTGHHLPRGNEHNSTNTETELIKAQCLKDETHDLPYDVCSLMHIGPFSYSKNRLPVFSPKLWRVPCSGSTTWTSDLKKLCHVIRFQLQYQYNITLGCFPPSSTVLLENGERKTIRELMIGERVMVMDEHNHVTFSDVHLMMHKQDDMSVNYVILESETGQTLTASPEHVVYVASHWSYKPKTRLAEKVKVGGYVFRPEMSNGTFVPVRVMAVRREVIKGGYAPTTLAGNVVVDGHLASSYVYIENQDVSHSFFLPWRVSYRMHNAVFGKTLHVPAPGLHWSLRWFIQVYCRIIGHDVCESLLKVA